MRVAFGCFNPSFAFGQLPLNFVFRQSNLNFAFGFRDMDIMSLAFCCRNMGITCIMLVEMERFLHIFHGFYSKSFFQPASFALLPSVHVPLALTGL